MDDQQRDELIVRIDERVLAIQSSLGAGEKRMNDHSKRLHILEKWRSALAAVVATIIAAIGIALRLK